MVEGVLGQLFHSLNPVRRSVPRTSSDGQIECIHTKELLYPGQDFIHDGNIISPTFPTVGLRGIMNNDCSHGDVELECPRDVRVLIAQAETGSTMGPSLLFDSKQSESNLDSPRIKHSRFGSRFEITPHHTRTASGPARQFGKPPAIEPIPEQEGRESPTFPLGSSLSGLAQRSGIRRSSMPAAQPIEDSTLPRHRDREIDDTVQMALSSMFENVASSYKGVSYKIKIIPLETKPYDGPLRVTPLGNPSGHNRKSRLSAVFTPSDPLVEVRSDTALKECEDKKASEANVKPTAKVDNKPREEGDRKQGKGGESKPTVVEEDIPPPELRRRTVLVTCTFSVPWTEEDALGKGVAQSTPGGRGVVKPGPIDLKGGHRAVPRQYPKPPMYAITLVLSLPISDNNGSPPLSRSGASRRLGSEPTSLASSLGSQLSVMDPTTYGFGLDMSISSIGSDVDERVDLVGKHWDLIVRTLSTLQHIVAEKILPMLRLLPKQGRPPKLLYLGLAEDNDIKEAVLAAGLRVIRGLKIPRVQTGQGRWAAWRKEARLLDKWTSGKDRHAFFYNLINAFLGNHTEWLNTLAHKYRHQRGLQNQQLGSRGPPEDLSIPSRTVIVSMSAATTRRLIFLLSQFLPANSKSRGDASPFRPGTARSYSQSPPSLMVPPRQEPLRRTINRKPIASASLQPASGSKTLQPSSPTDVQESRPETTIRFEDQAPPSRRGSETPSRSSTANADGIEGRPEPTIRFGDQLPPSRRGSNARPRSAKGSRFTDIDIKSSSTSSALTSDTVLSVAHTSTRPRSSDSFASENLLIALHRTNTGSSDTQPLSRWNSIKSFLSGTTRRDSETDYSSVDPSDNDEGLGISGFRHSDHLYGKLQHMVEEGEADRMKNTFRRQSSSSASPENTPATPEILPSRAARRHGSVSQPIDIPPDSLKMSVDQDTGIVDIAFPGFGSPPVLSSSPLAGFYSASSYDGFGSTSFPSQGGRETIHPMNVAGVLNSIHPDFELQGVHPYDDMVKDLKAVMAAEPIPASRKNFLGSEPKEEWVEVCTSLIADTRNFSITRLRLLRRVRFVPPPAPTATPTATPAGRSVAPLKSQYGNPYTDAQLAPVPPPITLEERFEEEKIVDCDNLLADALDRILAQSGRSSRTHSSSSSRSSSRRGHKDSTTGDDGTDFGEMPHSECRKLFREALVQITAAVRRNRSDEQRYGSNRLASLHDDTNSALCEGIRKWFDEVDMENLAVAKAREERQKEEGLFSDDASTIRPTHARRKHKKIPSENENSKTDESGSAAGPSRTTT